MKNQYIFYLLILVLFSCTESTKTSNDMGDTQNNDPIVTCDNVSVPVLPSDKISLKSLDIFQKNLESDDLNSVFGEPSSYENDQSIILYQSNKIQLINGEISQFSITNNLWDLNGVTTGSTKTEVLNLFPCTETVPDSTHYLLRLIKNKKILFKFDEENKVSLIELRTEK